jgi:hypothetical protein
MPSMDRFSFPGMPASCQLVRDHRPTTVSTNALLYASGVSWVETVTSSYSNQLDLTELIDDFFRRTCFARHDGFCRELRASGLIEHVLRWVSLGFKSELGQLRGQRTDEDAVFSKSIYIRVYISFLPGTVSTIVPVSPFVSY